ncbi:hypothetical protein ACFTZI_14360 [Streptomyces decoyicus]|uniref:hypothetical protein n=1 Tax=Streptomyces decoyicus TaxID=249567 RepID=UPI0036403216
MTRPEDRQQQAVISRSLLDHLNAPIAEGCRVRGVLPDSGAVRIAIHAGDDEDGDTFLYEIPHGAVAPACLPGILRTTLTGTQIPDLQKERIRMRVHRSGCFVATW